MIKLSMKNIKSSDVQSPLNDQKKGVGFILVKNAIMKNVEGNFQSPGTEKAASTGDGSNFFTFLGIISSVRYCLISATHSSAEIN